MNLNVCGFSLEDEILVTFLNPDGQKGILGIGLQLGMVENQNPDGYVDGREYNECVRLVHLLCVGKERTTFF